MVLSDVLDYLKYGELSQIGISDYSIDENRKRVISNINLGLTEIYKRLELKQSEVIIQQYPQIGTYHLLDKYTQTKGSSYINYIMDSPHDEFYESTVITIQQLFTEDREEVPINDDDRVYSVFIPTPNSIQIPYAEEENAFSIIYLAKPKNIELDAEDSTYIELPDYLVEALLVYVASRVTMTVNSETSDTANYFAKFEGIINNIKMQGLVNKENFSNFKLINNGWV